MVKLKEQTGISKVILIITIIAVVLVFLIVMTFIMRQPKHYENSVVNVLQIGDYVEYIADIATYVPNEDGQPITGNDEVTPMTTDNTIKWRVWAKSDNNIFIIPEVPVNMLYLGNDDDVSMCAAGYVNGPNVMNNVCKRLYKNKALGITEDDIRSMTYDDIIEASDEVILDNEEKYAYFFAADSNYSKENSGDYKSVRINLNDLSNIAEPRFYAYDKGGEERIDDNGVEYRTPAEENPVYVTHKASPIKMYWKKIDNPNVSSIKNYGDILGKSYDKGNWLASQGIDLYNYGAEFFLYRTYGEGGVRETYITSSRGGVGTYHFGIRPLITLDSNVRVDISDIERDGTSSETAYKLMK